MPANNGIAGLAANTDIQGKYVDQVTVTGGIIAVRYGNSAHAIIDGAQLQLAPDTTRAGSVQWNCTTGTPVIENKHLPAACRT
jgi:type IV pilus assembly protein PilA